MFVLPEKRRSAAKRALKKKLEGGGGVGKRLVSSMKALFMLFKALLRLYAGSIKALLFERGLCLILGCVCVC